MNSLDSNQYFNYYQIDNLIVVDTNLTNYQSLIPDTNNIAVVLIDSQENGIKEITTVLEQYNNLDSISIFSHGDVGSIQLGNTYLSNHNLGTYQNDLAIWGNALSLDGDLLLYGCNIGGNKAGLDFVDRIGEITGADVAASTDLTGNAELGGDWTLEVATGTIETPTFEVTEYGNLLDLKFNITYDEDTGKYQKRAFEMAAKMWSNVLNDDATINIHVSMASNSDLPNNTLGGAVPAFVLGNSYSDVRQKLVSDRTTSDDYTAVNSLETGSTWDTIIDSGWMSTSKVALTRANAKALNIINPHSNALDGTVVMNNLKDTGLSWSQKYHNNYTESNKFDFTTVAMHEIGHILGFVSAVDAMTPTTSSDASVMGEAATSLDLFRYIHSGFRDLRLGWANFSIDGGATELARMSWGADSDGYQVSRGVDSDGYQASHWKNEDNTGLMDPVAELGQLRTIGNMDLKALDVIGWDRVAGTKSVSTLHIEAQEIAFNKSNINRNVEVGQMMRDWRWARRGSRDRLRQDGNIAQFLSQEGFFSVGAFRESFDFSSVNPVIKNDFITVVDNHSLPQEFSTNNDLDVANSSEIMSGIDIQDVVVESSGINYEEMVALVTEELSDHELSKLSLDDLAQLIEQQLVEPIVSALN